MIKYNLKCKAGHEFESWFSDSKEFDKLNKKKLLGCIYCSSKNIQKSIMSPMVSAKKLKNDNPSLLKKNLLNEKKKLLKLRDYVEKNCEFVGDKLSEKAKELYYDKKSKKSIYGTATDEEREELAEEGINIVTLPWARKDN
jgi:hypothetical protein